MNHSLHVRSVETINVDYDLYSLQAPRLFGVENECLLTLSASGNDLSDGLTV